MGAAHAQGAREDVRMHRVAQVAEPDSLVVMMDFADRDALIEEAPDTYYLKDHYLGYPCVLVRLSRVHPDALRDLVIGAHRYVSAKSKSAGRSRRRSTGRQDG